jgi:hypothetical protein
MTNEDNDQTFKERLSPSLEKDLHGAKLLFGDKLVDPMDRRVRKPHSRVVGPFAGATNSHTNIAEDNTGGLLQTGGHRPTVVPIKSTNTGEDHTDTPDKN